MSLKNILLRTINQKNKYINLAATAVKINQEQYNYREQNRQYRKTVATALFSSVLIGTVLAEKSKNESKGKDKNKDDNICEAGERRPDLPTYRAEEVSKHDSVESFWVIYKNGVYDVTSFLPSHPGGDQIMNAGGLSIEPFWNVYGMHKTKDICALLESYRIGNLHEDDMMDHSGDELWVKEPSRDKRLIVKTSKPFNAEIPAKLQVEHFDTPNELFYVRQHMPVPELDSSQHRVRVTIENGETVTREFSLQQLDMFPRTQVRAALMCAGNRRSEMNEQVKPVKGISWQGGAISNAVWEGVLLVDVLRACGVDNTDVAGKHVIFTGSDIDATGVNFSTSIPLEQALNPSNRILLATHMNGAVLPPDHGHPLRAVVPGAPAVRSVKWLESITISKDESSSHWHQKDYRSFNASKTWETADFATAPPIYSLPVTSAICDPANGDTVVAKNGVVEIRGYAYSGGGAKILRVDISPDCGETWVQAEEMQTDDAPPQQHYSWTLWTARIPVRKEQKEIELWAKATDSNFNTQPEKFDDIWNIRGLLSNAYHRIKVQIKH
ncbi:probable sulfite oxidase, mitochondrial isoform X1 [Spodoptera litura]|uniref:sulfite oxidase n=1 Tax=Spodoptera litura TaxID=69820 RepID=A0A9J7E5N6_SPOLT|nr:probable sulfite oxidase, mitochondrial isoform X1 [Spodoptera litura]